MSALFQAFLQDPTIVHDSSMLSTSTRIHISKYMVRIVDPIKLTETLDKTKSFIRADDFDDDNDLITDLIRGCSNWAESYAWHSFITQTWTMTMDSIPRRSFIEVRMPPLISVTKISSFDRSNVETTFPDTEYFVDLRGRGESRIILNEGSVWPTDIRAYAGFKIEFISGYGADETDVPDELRTAVKNLVGVKYENREESQDKRFDQAIQTLTQFMTPRM